MWWPVGGGGGGAEGDICTRPRLFPVTSQVPPSLLEAATSGPATDVRRVKLRLNAAGAQARRSRNSGLSVRHHRAPQSRSAPWDRAPGAPCPRGPAALKRVGGAARDLLVSADCADTCGIYFHLAQNGHRRPALFSTAAELQKGRIGPALTVSCTACLRKPR